MIDLLTSPTAEALSNVATILGWLAVWAVYLTRQIRRRLHDQKIRRTVASVRRWAPAQRTGGSLHVRR